MKEIKVTDEMYDFLMDLSKELNNQDPRATEGPFFFQVQQQKEIEVPDGCGERTVWRFDGTFLRTDEDIKEAVFEWNEWNIENREHIKKYENMKLCEIEEILENNYIKHDVSTKKTVENCFLTERACKEHIKMNSYHYCEPKDFLTHAFKSNEFEEVLRFLHGLTGGSVHK